MKKLLLISTILTFMATPAFSQSTAQQAQVGTLQIVSGMAKFVPISSTNPLAVTVGTSSITGIIPIVNGGTGASTATGALSNLTGNPATGSYVINCTSSSSCTVISSAGSVNLGTSAAATNPSISGAPSYGFYTPDGSTQIAVSENTFKVMQWNPTASSVDYITVTGAATLTNPTLTASGTDTNISLVLTPKGTGGVGIGTTLPGNELEVVNNQNNVTRIQLDNNNVGAAAFAEYRQVTDIGDFREGTGSSLISSGLGLGGASYIDVFANKPLQFGTNNNERMRITSAGSVGIGSTAPLNIFNVGQDIAGTQNTTQSSAQLILSGTTNPNKELRLGFDTTNNLGFIQSTTWASSANPITINASGGIVGIGTSNPLATFDVQNATQASNAATGSAFRVNTITNEVDYISIMPAATANPATVSISALGTDANINLSMLGKGTGNVLVPSSNVGIGTTTPATTLEIGALGGYASGWPAVSIRSFPTSGSGATLFFNNSGTNYWGLGPDSGNLTIGTVSGVGNGLSFLTKTIEMTQTGNVGIGTTTPAGNLDIYGASNVNGISLTGAVTASPPLLAAVGSDTNIQLQIQGKGNQGIRINGGNGAQISAIFGAAATLSNYFLFTSGSAGNPAVLATAGGDTNISLSLNPKGTGGVSIGTTVNATAGAILDLSANTTSNNSTLLLPIGTTGTRPSPATNGMLRYNSTATPQVEAYVNNAWVSLGGGSGTVTTTGSPVSGNLTAFTGATSIGSTTSLPNGTTAMTQANGDTSTDVATDAFVTNAIQSQVDVKDPVQAATTTTLLFSPSYSNGSSGVGATLTATSVGVLILDGYTPALNDRILVKNQAASLQNGCYTVTTLGVAITTDYVLTRCTDFNQAANILYGDSFPVLQGTTNANQQFTMNNQSFTTVGAAGATGQIAFAQTSGGSQLVQGAGITITGNTIALTTPVTVALGGTNATSASITAFNNITGYTAAGATGTTSTNLVFSTSPTFITPTLGAASATSINFGQTTLNNYTESTYIPTLTCGTSGTITVDGTANTASNERIGNIMHVHGRLLVNSVSSPLGALRISIPTALSNPTQTAGRAAPTVDLSGTVSANAGLNAAIINEGEQFITVYTVTATSGTGSGICAQIQANTTVTFDAWYRSQ